MYIIVCGNPADGFRHIGPFDAAEEARQHIETDPELRKGSGWVVELDTPASEMDRAFDDHERRVAKEGR